VPRRNRPTLTEQLAAALLALGHIPFEHAREMTAKQIIGLYQFDHWPIRVEAGGTNHPSNMRPLLIAAHRKKTAADNREIGKIRRTRRKHDEHRQRMLVQGGYTAPGDGSEPKPAAPTTGSGVQHPRSRWPSRPFPKL
jgi:hypothetical protein